jgi:rhodanese-related sulfurtransferase
MGDRMKIGPVIARAAGLLAIAAAAALFVNTLSPVGIPLFGQWNAADGVVSAGGTAEAAEREGETVSVEKARAVFDADAAVFVDARPKEAFFRGHVPGAVSLPVRAFDERIADFWERHSPEDSIVTYCSGRSCEDSHRLALLLREAGYEKVRVFVDGYSGWVAAGHPTAQGEEGGER